MTCAVRAIDVEPRRIVALRRRIDFATDDHGSIIGDAYGELYDVLPADLLGDAGANVIAYEPVGDTTADMLVGVEWPHEAPTATEIVGVPGGRVAHTCHEGPYTGLPVAHATLREWNAARGQPEVRTNWEVYGDWSDDPAQLVTDVFHTIAPATGTR